MLMARETKRKIVLARVYYTLMMKRAGLVKVSDAGERAERRRGDVG